MVVEDDGQVARCAVVADRRHPRVPAADLAQGVGRDPDRNPARAGDGEVGARQRLAVVDSACSSPYTRLSSSARHDASMMFVLTPMVVQSRWPFVASRRTRVTAPVAPAPSRMRTLKSVRWTRSSAG